MSPQGVEGAWRPLALFPLGTVLFPDGLLPLRVFEARYTDLVSNCLREGSAFGVVTLNQGGELRQSQAGAHFEVTGCLAQIVDCDSERPGILQVQCRGTGRFLWRDARQREDGLWLADALELPADQELTPPREQIGCVKALERAIAALAQRDQHPFALPHRLDQAGWVANRWCELLPLPLATRHKLMALPDPRVRLALVDGFLRRHRIVTE
ncbi:MAG: LON peptidase substrate-binding domain-containing protein [Burkholderiales bacterium]|jgi:Lon protease-like protein|nr:LON peptidase substrate-binding domain-containing protein [Burkholderiales bacterium]MBP7519319.1 LON peptidase substrate-binding domain-containing protein [Leptothrix sp. (in: b-proteobacteria)]HQY07142.1 LON peptidase substrate-binding domain-containing protein [Burkholderiaceae bacterium]